MNKETIDLIFIIGNPFISLFVTAFLFKFLEWFFEYMSDD